MIVKKRLLLDFILSQLNALYIVTNLLAKNIIVLDVAPFMLAGIYQRVGGT
jgi:hypothetical protein